MYKRWRMGMAMRVSGRAAAATMDSDASAADLRVEKLEG